MDEAWSYCSDAMTFRPDGNPGRNPARELAGSLYLCTHLSREVGEISIPIPTHAADTNAWPRAALHTGGRSLVVGDTFLSGGEVIAHGPSLYAVAPWEKGRMPVNGEAISAVELLRYSSGSTPSNRVLNFRIDETGKGAVWLARGGRTAVAIAYSAKRGGGTTSEGGAAARKNERVGREPWSGPSGLVAVRRLGVTLLVPLVPVPLWCPEIPGIEVGLRA